MVGITLKRDTAARPMTIGPSVLESIADGPPPHKRRSISVPDMAKQLGRTATDLHNIGPQAMCCSRACHGAPASGGGCYPANSWTGQPFHGAGSVQTPAWRIEGEALSWCTKCECICAIDVPVPDWRRPKRVPEAKKRVGDGRGFRGNANEGQVVGAKVSTEEPDRANRPRRGTGFR